MFKPLAAPKSLWLPPELMLQIFEYATFVVHALDTVIEDPFHRTSGGRLFLDLREESDDLIASISTKASLVLVCKYWHATASPLLYQILYIRRREDLPSLEASLKMSTEAARVDGSHYPPFGWWTRRLSLAFDYNGTDEKSTACLHAIIAFLPSLRIFTIGLPTIGIPYTVAKALIDTCAKSLQRLQISGRILYRGSNPPPDPVQIILNGAPGLRSVICEHRIGPTTRYHNFENLEFITVDARMEWSPLYIPVMPSVRQLYFTFFGQYDATGAMAHLAKCLPSVSTIYVDVAGIYRSFAAFVDNLGQFATLRHLIYDMVSWSAKGAFDLPPTVTHLGLHVRTEDPCELDIQDFSESLESIRGSSLQVVRMLNAVAVRNLQHAFPSEFRDCILAVSSNGLRVEDHHGELLDPSP